MKWCLPSVERSTCDYVNKRNDSGMFLKRTVNGHKMKTVSPLYDRCMQDQRSLYSGRYSNLSAKLGLVKPCVATISLRGLGNHTKTISPSIWPHNPCNMQTLSWVHQHCGSGPAAGQGGEDQPKCQKSLTFLIMSVIDTYWTQMMLDLHYSLLNVKGNGPT